VLDVCQAWGGITLAEWRALPREDRVMRIAHHRVKLQPLTPERQEEADRARRMREAENKRRARGA